MALMHVNCSNEVHNAIHDALVDFIKSNNIDGGRLMKMDPSLYGTAIDFVKGLRKKYDLK